MADERSPEALFLENLASIDRTASHAARLSGLATSEREDFVAWVRLRLVENDYEILRKFRGESSVSTYLKVVIAMLARDYRVRLNGRWRPSAAARRRGEVAVRLETLVHRRGIPLREAVTQLRSSGATTLSTRAIGRLFAELPLRMPLRPVDAGEAALDGLTGADRAEDRVSSAATTQAYERTMAALNDAIAKRSPEDRAILRLHFWEGLSVAGIAGALSLEQKPLYRRRDRLLKELRIELERQGLDAGHLRELLDEEDS